jgi:aminoglycoside phosphotransferase (APT) family kinase protein
MVDNAKFPVDLVEWMETVAGGRMSGAERQPGGGRKEAWFIDITRPDDSVDELFLRYDRARPTPADPWTLHREATVYLALQDTDVPVARVLGVHPQHQAMLSARVSGGSWFSRITDADEQLVTSKNFMKALAALHRIEPASLDLPLFPPPTSVPDLVRHELDEWERAIDARGGDPDPALRFSLDWLRRNIPDYQGPVVLVQGDTGPGNFMYEYGEVTAVVDWELAHFGDPMDDIAWLCLRSVQDPFPDFPARLREYEALSGRTIDDDRVRYYQVLAETKLQVMGHRPGGAAERYANVGTGADLGNGLIYPMLHRRLWLEALAAATGLECGEIELAPTHERTEYDATSDMLLAQLRDVIVPMISDPFAQRRTKGLARVVKYLAELNAHRSFYVQAELEDIRRVLGVQPESLAAGRRAVAEAVGDGVLSDADYLGYLWRRTAGENELLRSASGALANRHWPPLR